jgi:N6-L-threonylcarbamoyladenine synthase
MKILAIETSCDDTCAAVLENDKILSSVVSTQIVFHKKYGGVVPRIAKEKHSELIDPCIKKALARAKTPMDKIDAIAVTYGPGLAIALEVGVKKTKELHLKYNKPIIAVNHLEGHLLSPFLKDKKGKLYSKIKMRFPFISMIVSGGHTEIILVKGFGEYELIGQTLDDAAGECFDKVARLLRLGYPGGPVIEKVAKNGERKKYLLPKPFIKSEDFNFSFSGLKTGCLVALRKIYLANHGRGAENAVSFDLPKEHYDSKEMFFSKKEISDFAATFEATVAEILATKIVKAAKIYSVKCAAIGGGVSANIYLRSELRKNFSKIGVEIALPEKKFCTDNAAMIGIAAYYKALRKEYEKKPMELDRNPSLNFK